MCLNNTKKKQKPERCQALGKNVINLSYIKNPKRQILIADTPIRKRKRCPHNLLVENPFANKKKI